MPQFRIPSIPRIPRMNAIDLAERKNANGKNVEKKCRRSLYRIKRYRSYKNVEKSSSYGVETVDRPLFYWLLVQLADIVQE